MSGDPAAQTHNVHVVVLYPLMSGEGIRDQRRPHAGHLVGRNASPYPAAADGQAPGDLTPRHRPGQGHHKIRVVISGNQLIKLIFIFIVSAMPAALFASVYLWGSSFRISRSACPQS